MTQISHFETVVSDPSLTAGIRVGETHPISTLSHLFTGAPQSDKQGEDHHNSPMAVESAKEALHSSLLFLAYKKAATVIHFPFEMMHIIHCISCKEHPAYSSKQMNRNKERFKMLRSGPF